jgi:dihydrolipoamide dehydrogenase
MFKEFVIIGGGPAGNAAALAVVEGGASSIAIVERDAFGGTCTNRGCIPTKFLLSKSEVFSSRESSGPGSGEWERLVRQKTALVGGLSRSIETRLASRGVEIVRGSARFLNPNEVEVAGVQGTVTRVEGRTFIVATGSEPARLPGVPERSGKVITSNEALDLSRVPASLAVIGSGAVGSEFCFIFTRLGVKVTLVEAADRLFPHEDSDVDASFRRVFGRLGVRLHIGSAVTGIEERGDGVAVLLESGEVVEAEMALLAVGRALGSRGLGCEAAGIATGAKGEIVVDDDLRTSQGHIFAVGDVNGRMLLAHAASFMGEQAGRRACGLAARPVPYRSIPWATFTTPEIGSVGLTPAAAEASGFRAIAASIPLMESVKARIDRTTEGFLKVVVEQGTGRILGGTVVGPHASDLVHTVALAIHRCVTVSDMRGFTFVHPSVSELFGDLYSKIQINV